MTNLCKCSALCLAVMVTAVAACSSPQSLVAPGDDGGGDAGLDASPEGGVDSPTDGGVDPPTDGRVDPSTDGGVTPDAPAPEDLIGMCGAVPTTTQEWEACRLKRLCEADVHCSEENLHANVQECIDLSSALSGGEIASDTFEKVRSVAAGRASINVAAFTECLNELSSARCNTAGTAPSCPIRYTGTVPDSEACFDDAECISPGASCTPRDCGASCCMGVCTPRAKLGQPCNEFTCLPGRICCEPGLVCNLQTCVTGDVGSACDHSDCDPGNWCDNGICKPDLAEGAACDGLLECGGETECVGLAHGVTYARCGRLTVAGDACDWFCFGNLYCDRSNSQSLGVCRPLPTDGEACSVLLPCVGQNERCSDQGMCIPRTGLNLPCTDGTCIPGLFCTDQLGAAGPVCRAPFADNELGCKQDAQCQSHICTGNQTTAGQCLPAQLTCP